MSPDGLEPGVSPKRQATWRIVALSAVVNLALLLVFEVARQGIWPSPSSIFSIAGLADGARSDNPNLPEQGQPAKVDLQESQLPAKESLKLTIARQAAVPAQTVSMGETAPAEGDPDPEQRLLASSSQDSQAMAPVLLKDPKSGQVRIGQFKSLTMEGDSEQCLDIAHSMLEDIGANGDLLDVMAASDSITIAKICTANGNVVFTCRNNSVVISPRKPRPNESCEPA